MAPTRRSVLAAGATGTLAATAGCLEFALGDGPLEFEADRAAPTDTALAETGYEEDRIERQSFDETVSFGLERDVRATFWLSTYTKSTPLSGDEFLGAGDELLSGDGDSAGPVTEPLARGGLGTRMDDFGIWDDVADTNTIAVVSTPGLDVFGRSFNPLADLSHEELLEELLGASDSDVRNLDHQESVTLEILAESRDVDRFVGETASSDGVVDVGLTITSIEHGDDFLAFLGAHPAVLDDETDNIDHVLTSVEHPV